MRNIILLWRAKCNLVTLYQIIKQQTKGVTGLRESLAGPKSLHPGYLSWSWLPDWLTKNLRKKNLTQGKTFQHAFASQEMYQHQRPYGLNPSALPCKMVSKFRAEAIINTKSHSRPHVHLVKGLWVGVMEGNTTRDREGAGWFVLEESTGPCWRTNQTQDPGQEGGFVQQLCQDPRISSCAFQSLSTSNPQQ